MPVPYTNWLVILVDTIVRSGPVTFGCQQTDKELSGPCKLRRVDTPVPNNALAAAVALYDSKYVNPSLYSSPNSTIMFFLEYNSGEYPVLVLIWAKKLGLLLVILLLPLRPVILLIVIGVR